MSLSSAESRGVQHRCFYSRTKPQKQVDSSDLLRLQPKLYKPPEEYNKEEAGALRVVPHTRSAVVRERGLSSGRVGLATGGYLGLECCRLLALGLGWLEALPWRPPTLPAQFSRTAYGFGNPVPFEYIMKILNLETRRAGGPRSWFSSLLETWTPAEQKGKGSNNCSVTTWPVLQNLHAVGPDAMVRATKAFKRIACVASDRGGDAPEWRSGHHGLRAVATFAAR